ncbi:hypothetical protein N9493_04045 [Amylibacter sp.]|jgi:hypothetical protein|nr:hypothetical protein [Amylibacter sp.]
MVNIEGELIILLPHLDDEYAFIPYLNSMASEKLKFTFIFCAERLTDTEKKQKKRRSECIKSISLLKQKNYQIYFLNDYFPVDDLKLYLASEKIYLFVLQKLNTTNLNLIATTALEGGHPDHDAIALIAHEIQTSQKLPIKYFPLYNSRKTLGILPVSVLRPLKDQIPFACRASVGKFCWFPALRLAIIYKTEISAFCKILPFIILKAIFSRSFYFFEKIERESVNWDKSLSVTRYRVEPRKMDVYIKKAMASHENLHISK